MDNLASYRLAPARVTRFEAALPAVVVVNPNNFYVSLLQTAQNSPSSRRAIRPGSLFEIWIRLKRVCFPARKAP
jgi:hypothetical protein